MRRDVTAGKRFGAGTAALFVVIATSGVLLTAQQSADAASGAVVVEPAEGATDWGNIRLVTDRQCPAQADALIVTVEGANFPKYSNAVGNTELVGVDPDASGRGLVVPLPGSWDAVAQANGGSEKLDGTAELTFLCIKRGSPDVLEAFAGEVKFSVAGKGQASRYKQNGGPALVSGIPLTANDVKPYVYRTDAPPSGASTSGAAAPAAASGNEPAAQPGAEDSLGRGPVTVSPGFGDTSTTASQSSSGGGSSTALLVGIAVMGAAGTWGYVTYSRARRQQM